MARVEKTIFVSYRRPNLLRALAIYQKLSAHGYDVFFDRGDPQRGDFEQTIINNIRARAHFLILLTPSALEGFDAPDDLMRREIETALDEKCNIVCLFFENAGFSSPSIGRHLTGKMANLKLYPSLNVPADHFDETMSRLHEKFLNIPVDVRLYSSAPSPAQNMIRQEQAAVINAAHVGEEKLTAQEWYERGWNSSDLDEQIHCYTEAIRLKADYTDAYSSRGIARESKGDLAGAIQDHTEAIRLQPGSADAYNNRGATRKDYGELDGAIQDCTEAIRIKPDFAAAYNNRGLAHQEKGDLDPAIDDFTRAIELEPIFVPFYINRGGAFRENGDPDNAIQDFNKAIQLKPDSADAYNGRGNSRKDGGDLDGAIEDYTKAIQLQGHVAPYYYNRGIARYQKGDPYGAFDDYTEAIRLQPDHYGAYNNRAIVSFDMGDMEGAIQGYTEVIHIKPDFVMAYKNRASAWMKKPDYMAVIADLQNYLFLGGGIQNGDQDQIEEVIRTLEASIKG